MDPLAPVSVSNVVPDDIPAEHLDYSYVEKCSDPRELRALLETLKSGKHGKYEHLERTTEERLLAVLSPAQAARYIALNKEVSHSEKAAAAAEVDAWLAAMRLPAKGGAAAAATAPAGGAGGAAPKAAAPLHVLPPVRGATPVGQHPAKPGLPAARPAAAPAPAPAPARAAAPAPATAERRLDPKAMPFDDYYKAWDKYDVEGRLAEQKVDDAAGTGGMVDSDDEDGGKGAAPPSATKSGNNGVGPVKAATVVVKGGAAAPAAIAPPSAPGAPGDDLLSLVTAALKAAGAPRSLLIHLAWTAPEIGLTSCPHALDAPLRATAASREKAKGNEAVRTGDAEAAVRWYSRALALDGGYVGKEAAILWGNRAQAHLAQGLLESAEADATAALACDPSYAKAWLRRGNARMKRGRYGRAWGDFTAAVAALAGSSDAAAAGGAALRKEAESLAAECVKLYKEQRGGLALDTAAAAAACVPPQALAATVARALGQPEAAAGSWWGTVPPATLAAALADALVALWKAEVAAADVDPPVASKPAAPGAKRIAIVEVEDDEDEDEDEGKDKTSAASAAPASAPAPVPAPGATVSPSYPALTAALDVVNACKDVGNAQFSRGDYSAALETYGEGVAELRRARATDGLGAYPLLTDDASASAPVLAEAGILEASCLCNAAQARLSSSPADFAAAVVDASAAAAALGVGYAGVGHAASAYARAHEVLAAGGVAVVTDPAVPGVAGKAAAAEAASAAAWTALPTRVTGLLCKALFRRAQGHRGLAEAPGRAPQAALTDAEAAVRDLRAALWLEPTNERVLAALRAARRARDSAREAAGVEVPAPAPRKRPDASAKTLAPVAPPAVMAGSQSQQRSGGARIAIVEEEEGGSAASGTARAAAAPAPAPRPAKQDPVAAAQAALARLKQAGKL